MEDGVEIINGERFCRGFITERTDPYFLALQRGYQEIAAARLEVTAQPVERAWRLIGPETYEKSIEPDSTGLQIHGIAATPTINSHKQALDCKGIEVDLPVPLFSEHEDKDQAIGTVFYVRRSPTCLYVRACLHGHFAAKYAEKLIKNGMVSCLSIAPVRGKSTPLATVDGIRFFSGIKLAEVTICRQGANPDARFEVYRKGDDGKKFWGAQSSTPRVNPSMFSPDLAEAKGIPYRGPWRDSEQYEAGQFASHQGALWAALIQSKGVRPNEAPGVWQLCVKRGAVERMEKAHAGTSA
ncbi:hypothetical protein [Mesorhizobium sp. AA23]|uniref:hypothetical protein n=1 Tax=Mesorhizobium sp. AA23 TaxID=1854058 RepID=UPI0007FF504E|nr:hypothetical protein [Mesorhizobium sp. AA23]OBQ96813.1 hypothetical protein A9K66_20895 [Mesorhizobium sp. AA23]